jgi:hypothetical protein
MAEEEKIKVDIWALITIILIVICLAASFWATNTATQTRFDILQTEVRNLNDATHNEIRSVQRDVLENRALIRDKECNCGGSGAAGGR